MKFSFLVATFILTLNFKSISQIESQPKIVKQTNTYVFNDFSNHENSGFTGVDSVFYNDRGEDIFVLIQFENGERVRAKGYYDNGNKFREDCFKNQKRDGYSISYYKNGQINYLSYYKKGKEIAPTLQFYRSGSLKSFLDHKSDLAHGWYENGKLESESLPIDTIFEDAILTKYYYENGNPSRIVQHNIEKGLAIDYYENGLKSREGYIFNLELFQIGQWQEWHENGIKKREYFFIENQPNIKTGTWSWWDKEGNLIKQKVYKNNELIEEKEFLPFDEKKD